MRLARCRCYRPALCQKSACNNAFISSSFAAQTTVVSLIATQDRINQRSSSKTLTMIRVVGGARERSRQGKQGVGIESRLVIAWQALQDAQCE
jgi:hypothetical protein